MPANEALAEASVHFIEDGLLYRIAGANYSGYQLQRAIHCAHSVARAYEIADQANGGDGSVDWSDIDDAQAEAADALGAAAMQGVISDAREFNGFTAEGRTESDVEGTQLTPEESAEACREGWALFTHSGDVSELRIERIDCPDEGEALLADDNAAWQLVWSNPTPLHQKVLSILKEHSVTEYERLEHYNKRFEGRH